MRPAIFLLRSTLVHRRFRHARSEGGEGVARRTCVVSIERPVDFLDVRRIRSTPVSRARRSQPPDGIAFNEHYTGDGVKHACALCCEGTLRRQYVETARLALSLRAKRELDQGEESDRSSCHSRGRGGLAVRVASVTPLAICLWMTQGWFRMSPAVRQGGSGASKDSPVASLSRLQPPVRQFGSVGYSLRQLLQGHILKVLLGAPAGAAARQPGFP
jgi:hypothetical protein